MIAFEGGSTLCELGPREDVVAFFRCIDKFVLCGEPGSAFQLITERLYRRYLRENELELASSQMDAIRLRFGRVSGGGIDWASLGVLVKASQLELGAATLQGVFARYFDLFAVCVESAKLNFEEFREYPGYRFEPVRIVISDQPWYLKDQQRDLREYDELKGAPFWLEPAEPAR